MLETMDQVPQSVVDQLWNETSNDSWESFLEVLKTHEQETDGIEDWMTDKIKEVAQIIQGFGKDFPGSATELREMLVYYDNQY